MAMDPLLLPVKMEATGWKEEDIVNDDISYLSGKPFFDMVLTKSHVNPPYNLHIPVKMHRELPHATVSSVLRYNRKNWYVPYHGRCSNPRFGVEWKEFMIDNDLEAGDACVFELMKCSSTRIGFKVHILRGNLPPELEASVESRGSMGNPIVVD